MADKPTLGQQLGNISNTAGSVIGGVQLVKDLFTNKKKQAQREDDRQVRQQGRLNEVNAKTSKELADYEQQLKLKMWKDTNYGAQLAEADKAGVSKAAVLGGSGAGVGQGASVSGISGGGAADAASTQAVNQQAELMKAQIGNINADTKLKESQAGNVDAGTGNIELDSEWKKVQNEIAGRSVEAQIDIIESEAALRIEKLQHEKDTTGILLNTYLERVQKVKDEALQIGLQNTAIKQGISLDQAKIKQIANDITMRAKELEATHRGQDVSRENMEDLTRTMLISAGIQATGQVLQGFTNILMMKSGQKFKAGEATKDRSFKSLESAKDRVYRSRPSHEQKIKEFKKDGRINKSGIPNLNKFK